MDVTIGSELMGRMQAKWLLRQSGDYKYDLDRNEKAVNEETLTLKIVLRI